MLMLGKLIGNALNWTFLRLDASLLGHDATPTTCTPLFLKNCSSTHFYPLVPLPIVRIHSPATSERMAVGPIGRCVRLPSRCSARALALLGTVRSRL
jgi:hypothetical protein